MPEEKIDWTKIAEKKIFVYEINFKEAPRDTIKPFPYINFVLSYIREHVHSFYYKNEKENKYYGVESVEQNGSFYEIILKNCKYNFTPDIINVDTQEEHKSFKSLKEGDKEKTHILISGNTVYYESKRNGSSLYIFKMFVDMAIKNIKSILPVNVNSIVFSQILDNNFMDILKNSKKIKSTRFVVKSSLIGSQYFDFSNDNGVQDVYTLEIKAKRRNHFNKEFFVKKIEQLIAEGSKIEKILVDIYDEDDNLRVINTEEFAKFYKIFVDRSPTGEVISSDMFDKMKGLQLWKSFSNG